MEVKSKEIAAKLRDLEQYRAKLLALDSLMFRLEAIADSFADAKGPGVVAATPNSSALLYVLGCNTLRDVLPVIAALNRIGFHSNGYEDDAMHKCRRYAMKNDAGESVQVYVTLSDSEGASCRWVEVGKKEVPVMAIQCDEKEG